MAPRETRAALVSVHPQWAHALMDGRKGVEFRKAGVSPDIRIAIIYATSPVKQVVGWIEIEEVVFGSPRTLWRKFGSQGCIDRAQFMRYYAAAERGAAIVVKAAHPFTTPKPLGHIAGVVRPPQSFQYVPASVAAALMDLSGDRRLSA